MAICKTYRELALQPSPFDNQHLARLTHIEKRFGVAIKKLRECRNLTQEEVLQRTGIARSSLVEIETGKRFPRGINILRLCVLFEITPDQLMKLAFKKWKHPVKSLTSSRIGAPQQKYGDTGVASEAKTPKRIRSMRMRVDRGGTACIIVIQTLIKLNPNNKLKQNCIKCFT